MKIIIETIPHEKQRYPTCGDYWTEPDGTQRIVVSEMGNEDYSFLVAIHELAEWYLTQRRGITEAAIQSFDVAYEAHRGAGDVSEPGDAPDAPYQNEHNMATGIERVMAAALGVKWKEYDDTVASLP